MSKEGILTAAMSVKSREHFSHFLRLLLETRRAADLASQEELSPDDAIGALSSWTTESLQVYLRRLVAAAENADVGQEPTWNRFARLLADAATE